MRSFSCVDYSMVLFPGIHPPALSQSERSAVIMPFNTCVNLSMSSHASLSMSSFLDLLFPFFSYSFPDKGRVHVGLHCFTSKKREPGTRPSPGDWKCGMCKCFPLVSSCAQVNNLGVIRRTSCDNVLTGRYLVYYNILSGT